MPENNWPDGGIFADDEDAFTDDESTFDDENEGEDGDEGYAGPRGGAVDTDATPVPKQDLEDRYSPSAKPVVGQAQARRIRPDHLFAVVHPVTKQVLVAMAAVVNGKKVLLERPRIPTPAEAQQVKLNGVPLGSVAPLPDAQPKSWVSEHAGLLTLLAGAAVAGGVVWWQYRKGDAGKKAASLLREPEDGPEVSKVQYRANGQDDIEDDDEPVEDEDEVM